VSYTIVDFHVGDRVQWKRFDLLTNKNTTRTGTVKLVGRAKLTVFMDDVQQNVVVWPRNIANIVGREQGKRNDGVPDGDDHT
jgi:hypothetical protein